MHLRVRLTCVGRPKVIKTIHCNTTLNIEQLKHLMSLEELRKIFPKGGGVNFNFQERNPVILSPEGPIIAHLGSKLMLPDSLHPLEKDNILKIGEELFRLHVFPSTFSS